MSLNYLLDEHVDPLYQTQILRRVPELTVWLVGGLGAPRKGTLDPDILIWCEEHDFVLVTNNRHTMPDHLSDHLALGRHVPGIFILNAGMTIGETIDELLLLALASLPNEFADRTTFLPYS
jgi:hypothetical protein